jgi:hypothetical protein
LSAARELAALIEAEETVTRERLNSVLGRHFGGCDADGRWSVRDAHAALELAQVLWLQGSAGLTAASPAATAGAAFARLEALLPSQTVRSEEQIELQQFATPPRLAWLVARACALGEGETVLEPSAGTGMLAIWAARAGARLILNEISPLRRDCLGILFPKAMVSGHDGELIDELLDARQVPSAVLVNPPYSQGIERGHDGHTGARHLRSAWNRLAAGGRMAAIMPEWFDVDRFLGAVGGPATLRLNVAVERGFARHGTSITTRLLVLDKVEDRAEPVVARTRDFGALGEFVDAIPARPSAISPLPPATSSRPVPVRLMSLTARPRPVPPRQAAPAEPSEPCAYQALDVPAPLAEQVGHYLPYRPSRIAIPGAAEHPTPLVESVAMGSITAPIPTEVPQLPAGTIARGLLSAAQAETLIYAVSAHARDLPGRFVPQDKGCSLAPSVEGAVYRMGYFLGDGTGAGKGRQVASVILDRWLRGERRHIWISKNEALLEDARRDWSALGWDVGDVSEPYAIGRCRLEVLLEQVGRDRQRMTAVGGRWPKPPAGKCPDAVGVHQPLDPPPAAAIPFSAKRCMHPGAAVASAMPGMEAPHLHQQVPVGGCSRTLRAITPGIVAAWRHLEHAAHGTHRPNAAVLVDEGEPHFGVSEKMPMAFFKMSRSMRVRSSSRFSRAISAAWSAGDGSDDAAAADDPAACPARERGCPPCWIARQLRSIES